MGGLDNDIFNIDHNMYDYYRSEVRTYHSAHPLESSGMPLPTGRDD